VVRARTPVPKTAWRSSARPLPLPAQTLGDISPADSGGFGGYAGVYELINYANLGRASN